MPPRDQISVHWADLLWVTHSIRAFSKEKVSIRHGLHLEKLIVPQLAKKLPAFYGNYRVYNGQTFAPETVSDWSSLSYPHASLFGIIFRRFRISAESDYYLCHFVCLSAWNTSAPNERIFWNLIFNYFSKGYQQNSGFSSKDPDARGHTPSTIWTKWQQVATAGDTPDDGLIEARNM